MKKLLCDFEPRVGERDRLRLPFRLLDPASPEQQMHDAPVHALSVAAVIVDRQGEQSGGYLRELVSV
jgi:hypothetical protein